MIKSDIRYIIKRIIIGISIILGISLIRSCKVYALESPQYSSLFYNEKSFPLNQSSVCHSVGQKYKYVIDGYEYNIEYKSDGIYINDNFISNDNYYLCNAWIIGKWYDQPQDGNLKRAMFLYFKSTNNSMAIYNIYSLYVNSYSDNFGMNVSNIMAPSNSSGTTAIRRNYQYGNLQSSRTYEGTNWNYDNTNCTKCMFINSYDFFTFGVNDTTHYRLFSTNSTYKYITSDYSNPNFILKNPVINSLNPIPILSDDNSILLGFNFKLNFSYVDTRYFVYKYRVGNSRTLILNNNNYELSIRNNDTLYVWIEDLEGNVIDSETFTVSNIGNSYNGEYSIDFTYKDIAPSDTENTTGLSNIIDRVDINITYLPKTNILKYQYQYVNSGGSLDPQNWTQLNNNNLLNEYTYVVHDNGTLYARILDENDNVVANNTFTVDSIGKIKLFKNNSNISGLFSGFTQNINYNGPIYSLILMPINFLQIIYNTANSGVCNRYKIGTLFNNDIYFECFDLSDYIGSDLYNLLDVLSSSGVIYGIALFIKRKYNEFTNLNDNSNDIM